MKCFIQNLLKQYNMLILFVMRIKLNLIKIC